MRQNYSLFLENFKEKYGVNTPRIMFLGTYLFGLITLFLMIHFAPKNTLIIILMSILPMAIYGIYAFLNIREPNINVIADSAYFLGFLFTITSISIALYNLSPENKDLTDQFYDVIKIFGFALITTIAGLLIKITLVNLKPDFEDFSENVLDNLQESVALFDTELVNAIERFKESDNELSARHKEFTQKIKSMEKSTIVRTSDHLNKIISNSGQELEKFINQSGQSLTENMEASSKTLINTMNKVANDMEESGKSLNIPSDFFTEQLSEPLLNMKNQMNDFNNELSEVIKAQKTIASNTDKVTMIVAKLAEKMDIAEKLPDFVTVIQNSINEINLMTDSLQKTGNKLGEVSQSFDQLVKDGKENINHSKVITEQMKEDYNFFQDYNKKMKDTLMQSKQNMEILSRELTTAADLIVKKLDGSSNEHKK